MDENIELSSVEKMLFSRAAEKRVPIYAGFELTPYCNLACKMCYVKETAPGLPVMDGDAWLDIGRQAAEAGTLVVQLTGGEPMLHPEFKKIYSGLKAMGMVITMNTNATLIDEEMADFLAANMPRRMNVSLYGPNREVYQQLCGSADAFDKTIRAIELMQARNIPVKINLAPNTINFDHLDEMLAICKKYGLYVEMTTYMFEPIRKTCPGKQGYRLDPQQMAVAQEKLDRYRMEEKDMIARSIFAYRALELYDPENMTDELMPLACRAMTSSAWVCWDGRMNGCVNMTKPRADIHELGFAGAWEKVKEYGQTIRVPAKCMECSLRMFCQNCGAIGFHENGTFEKVPQIMCDAAEALARNLAVNVRKRERKVRREMSHETEKES